MLKNSRTPPPLRTVSLALACAAMIAACGGSDGAGATTATAVEPTTIATVAADSEGYKYSSVQFVVPFEVTVPPWLAETQNTDQSNFVTWMPSSDLDPAVRFLLPVVVYPPTGTGATPAPDDYLAYLLGQEDYGATFDDITETTVGGWPATMVTASVVDALDGSLGCAEEGTAAPDCFGLQPHLILRIAVIDTGEATLLAWLRHARDAGTDQMEHEFSAFEEMLSTVQFLENSAETGVATAVDGTWVTSFTRDELAGSPSLYDDDEVNDDNWGDMTFLFGNGLFRWTVNNAVTGSSTNSGSFELDGTNIVLDLSNEEQFVCRWRISEETLTFERDDSIGVCPTPFVVKPWTLQP